MSKHLPLMTAYCLLCLAHFKLGALCQAFAHARAGDSNSFSHILAGMLVPRVLLNRKFGVWLELY